MRLGAISGLKNTVLDLINARPAQPEPRPEPQRLSEPQNNERKGFNEILRDRPKAQPIEDTNAQAPRGGERGEVANSQVAEEGGQQEDVATDKPDTQDTTETGQQDEAGNSGAAKDGAGEASSETSDAEKQAAADAAASNANAGEVFDKEDSDSGEAKDRQAEGDAGLVQGLQLGLGPLTSSVVAAQTDTQANGNTSDREQLYAAMLKAHNETAKQQSAKDGSVPLLDTLMFSKTSTTGEGGLADNAGGEAGKEAKTPSQIAANNAAATNTGASSSAFKTADPGAEAARIAVATNPVPTQADASRQAATQALSNLNTQDNDAVNTSRLTRGLANAVQQRGGTVTLRLTPAEMGTVRIQMQITGTNVSASFHAESPTAQTLLTTQLAQLRSSLESQGMNVDRLSVQPLASTSSSQNTQQGQNDSQGQQNGQAQQDGANEGRSRGQYNSDRSGGGDNGGESQDQSGGKQNAMRGFLDRLNDAADEAA